MAHASRLLAAAVALSCGLAAVPVEAASFQTLYIFRGGTDGAAPYGRPLTGQNGLLYGTTTAGGQNGGGTIYQLDPATGMKTTLYDFTSNGKTGAVPTAALVADAKGNLYGTTESGGSTTQCASGCGVVFRLVPATHVLTILHTFSGLADGRLPESELVFGPGGLLYGTTVLGGITSGNCGSTGCGTVFALDRKTKVLTTLHAFSGSPGDGFEPEGGVVFDKAGVLYGTTSVGSTGNNNGSGTVYRYDTTANAYAVLHFFDYHTDGAAPTCTLAFRGGQLFGTTQNGGSTDAAEGSVFQVDPPSGSVTTLHNFLGSPDDGARPDSGVTPAPHGALVGTTPAGGGPGSGTAYTLNPTKNTYALLHVFADGADGAEPRGGLAVGKDGTAFGVTSSGNGTVFSIVP